MWLPKLINLITSVCKYNGFICGFDHKDSLYNYSTCFQDLTDLFSPLSIHKEKITHAIMQSPRASVVILQFIIHKFTVTAKSCGFEVPVIFL